MLDLLCQCFGSTPQLMRLLISYRSVHGKPLPKFLFFVSFHRVFFLGGGVEERCNSTLKSPLSHSENCVAMQSLICYAIIFLKDRKQQVVI